MIRKSVIDAPLGKSFYRKWLQETLLLPEGKALLLEGFCFQDASRIAKAARYTKTLSANIKANGQDGLFQVTIYRR